MKILSIGCLVFIAASVCASCAHTELTEEDSASGQQTTKGFKTISFSPFFLEVTEGSFGDIANWRSSGAASSRAGSLSELATTLSYWDYMDGDLIQESTTETSSPLEMKLPYGSHNIYFLAHSSTAESSADESFTFVPEKVTETFWADYPIEVDNDTEGRQTISLERVVSKAQITVKDAIPAGVSRMRMTVGSHYRTLDLKTGNATSAALPYSLSWELGSEYEGRAGLYFYIFTFTPASDEEFDTSFKIEALSAEDEVLFSIEADGISLLRNRCTNATCRLFSTDTSISFSDPGDWTPELELELK